MYIRPVFGHKYKHSEQLGIALHRKPREIGCRLQGVEDIGRLCAIAATGQNGSDLQAIENLREGLGVAARLVDASGLDRGRVEERISGDQEHHRRRPVTEASNLSREPVDAAKGIARAAAGLEIALEVGDERDPYAGQLGAFRAPGLAPAAAKAEAQGQYGKEATHPLGSSARAPSRKRPFRAAA